VGGGRGERERKRASEREKAFERAPDLCVEVLHPEKHLPKERRRLGLGESAPARAEVVVQLAALAEVHDKVHASRVLRRWHSACQGAELPRDSAAKGQCCQWTEPRTGRCSGWSGGATSKKVCRRTTASWSSAMCVSASARTRSAIPGHDAISCLSMTCSRAARAPLAREMGEGGQSRSARPARVKRAQLAAGPAGARGAHAARHTGHGPRWTDLDCDKLAGVARPRLVHVRVAPAPEQALQLEVFLPVPTTRAATIQARVALAVPESTTRDAVGQGGSVSGIFRHSRGGGRGCSVDGGARAADPGSEAVERKRSARGTDLCPSSSPARRRFSIAAVSDLAGSDPPGVGAGCAATAMGRGAKTGFRGNPQKTKKEFGPLHGGPNVYAGILILALLCARRGPTPCCGQIWGLRRASA